MFKGYWGILPRMVLFAALAGLIIAAAITCLMPKVFESWATLEIRHLNPIAPGTPNPDGIASQTIVRAEFVNIKAGIIYFK